MKDRVLNIGSAKICTLNITAYTMFSVSVLDNLLAFVSSIFYESVFTFASQT